MMLKERSYQSFTYLNRNTAQQYANSQVQQPNSTMLRLNTMTNDIMLKNKPQSCSTIKWREEKEKLLKKLTPESPEQKRTHVRQPTLSDTKHDKNRPLSPIIQTNVSTIQIWKKPSKSVPRNVQRDNKENIWDVDEMIKSYMGKKQSQIVYTEPDNQDNLKQRMQKIYSILEHPLTEQRGSSIQNKVSKLRMSINKVFLKGLNDQFTTKSRESIVNQVSQSSNFSRVKLSTQLPSSTQVPFLERMRQKRDQLQKNYQSSQTLSKGIIVPDHYEREKNQIMTIFNSLKKKKSAIKVVIDSPLRDQPQTQMLRSECVEINENQFVADIENLNQRQFINFKLYHQQENLRYQTQRTFDTLNSFEKNDQPLIQMKDQQVFTQEVNQDSNSQQPIIQKIAVKENVIQQYIYQQSPTQQPQHRPAIQHQIKLQPAILQPVILQPVILQPAILQPAILQPAFLQPAFLQPAFLQPVIQQYVIQQPLNQDSILRHTITQEISVQSPVSQQNLTPQPSFQEFIIPKHQFQQPIIRQSVIQQTQNPQPSFYEFLVPKPSFQQNLTPKTLESMIPQPSFQQPITPQLQIQQQPAKLQPHIQLQLQQPYPQLSIFEGNQINMAQSSFEQWIQERESLEKNFLVDEELQRTQKFQQPLNSSGRALPLKTEIDQALILVKNKQIILSKFTEGIQIIEIEFSILRKLLLYKIFSTIKEAGINNKRFQNQQQAIKDVSKYLEVKTLDYYTIVMTILKQVQILNRVQTSQSLHDQSLSFDDISKIQQPISIQQNDTIYSNIFQKIITNQKHSRLSSQVNSTHIYLQELNTREVKNNPDQPLQQTASLPKLFLQLSNVHQYTISKNDHTPVKTEIFLYNPFEVKTSLGKSQQSEKKRDSSSVKTNLSLVDQRSRYQSQYSQAKNDTKNSQNQIKIPQKDVKQMLLDISSPLKPNLQQEVTNRIRANMNFDYKKKNLESPEPRYMHQREMNDMSPIAEPRELTTETFCNITSANSISKQTLIQNSFVNFLQSRQSRLQQSTILSKHQSTRSHQCISTQLGRDKNTVLKDNINFTNQQEVNSVYQMTNNKNNVVKCNIYEQQTNNYISLQKAKISKKFQSMNRQNSGSIRTSNNHSHQAGKAKDDLKNFHSNQ